MNYEFKNVNIYIDEIGTLYFVPTTCTTNYGTVEVSNIIKLESPYSDQDIEEVLHQTLSLCNLYPPDDDFLKRPALAKYFNTSSYTKAIKGKKSVYFEWYEEVSGYTVVPTKKEKNGYTHLTPIHLGKVVSEGDFAKAIRKAIELSTLS